MNYKYIKQAAEAVRQGGVIAYPTEAVFGLGCLPMNFPAVDRILRLKQRSMDKGLIVIAAAIEQLEPFVIFPSAEHRETALNSWPGPVTWVVPARENVPEWLRGAHSSLAVRVSDHPIVRELCNEVGPLVSTSANPEGEPPAKSSSEVESYFPEGLDYILDGELGQLDRPTQIKDLLSGLTLR